MKSLKILMIGIQSRNLILNQSQHQIQIQNQNQHQILNQSQNLIRNLLLILNQRIQHPMKIKTMTLTPNLSLSHNLIQNQKNQKIQKIQKNQTTMKKMKKILTKK